MWQFIAGYAIGMCVTLGTVYLGFTIAESRGRTVISPEPKPQPKREHGSNILEYGDPTQAEY